MSRALGSKDFWLAALRADGPAFHDAIREAYLTAPVPSCPEWTVSDLIGHLGAVYGFVMSHVGRGVTTLVPPLSRAELGPPPGADLVSWWDGRFQELVAMLDGLDPELPAWNWAPQAKRVAFWHRRMAH